MFTQHITVFFAMGGFADYVWSAFGITAMVLTGLTVTSVKQHKKIITQIQNSNHASNP